MDDMTQKILTRALAMTGGGAGEGEALEPLCAAAERQLSARLREGETAETVGDYFVTAAALLALAMLREIGDADGVTSIKAGSVSVTRGAAGAAGTLRARADELMAPYMRDSGFVFRGVPG